MFNSSTSISEELGSIDCWLFDLDDTLYNPSTLLGRQISEKMTHYISNFLGMDGLSTKKLQHHYRDTYGTTLRGLMNEYAIDPAEFLSFSHDLDYGVLKQQPGLRQRMLSLSGRKIIVSNGPHNHILQTLNHLGLADIFEGIYGVEASDYSPKPEMTFYKRLLEIYRIDPTRAIFFDDIIKNHEPAKKLGMKTVVVHYEGKDPNRLDGYSSREIFPEYIDYYTQDLETFLRLSLYRPKARIAG